MKENTKAYTAGLFDAEGCIGLYLSTHKTTGRTHYNPSVVIANIHLPIIKWLVATFGGAYTKNTPVKGRPWYQWRASEGAEKFLSELLPYLKIKKPQAEFLLEYFRIRKDRNLEEMFKIAEKLRLLKDIDCSTTEMLDNPNTSDKLLHAYLAGFFDGEGCVSVGIASKINKPVLHINAANNYFPIIDLYKKVYSGWHQTNKAHGNTKESYRWWLTKKELQEKFLIQVLPYLKIKREQAILALKYVRLTPENLKLEKLKIAEKIKELNGLKIQSELVSNYESDLTETLEATSVAMS